MPAWWRFTLAERVRRARHPTDVALAAGARWWPTHFDEAELRPGPVDEGHAGHQQAPMEEPGVLHPRPLLDPVRHLAKPEAEDALD